MRFDWRPVVLDLLRQLANIDLHPMKLDDGGEVLIDYKENLSLENVVEDVCAVDEANLYVGNNGRFICALKIILGNAPDEIVADYTIPRGNMDAQLEQELLEHATRWENRTVPTKEIN